jgi:hypothetical protein
VDWREIDEGTEAIPAEKEKQKYRKLEDKSGDLTYYYVFLGGDVLFDNPTPTEICYGNSSTG